MHQALNALRLRSSGMPKSFMSAPQLLAHSKSCKDRTYHQFKHSESLSFLATVAAFCMYCQALPEHHRGVPTRRPWAGRRLIKEDEQQGMDEEIQERKGSRLEPSLRHAIVSNLQDTIAKVKNELEHGRCKALTDEIFR